MEGPPEPIGRPPVGIVLAAGAGERMGRPKALVLDPDGTSWLRRAVTVLATAGCATVVVVLGAGADEAGRLLDGYSGGTPLRVVEAYDRAHGMGASLRRGLAEADGTPGTAAVVTLVDLPDVGVDVVDRVLRAVGTGPRSLGRAAYQGVPGHPVVLGREHWAGVSASANGDRGARDYLAVARVELVECGDLASGTDRDWPETVP
jgi:CTP:molybdopterin cytidylyltransferase MocA